MAKDLIISEFLEDLSNIKTVARKKEMLIAYDSRQLRTFFKGAFDRSIVFNVPVITRPYTSTPNSQVGWGSVSSQMRFFVKGEGQSKITEGEIIDKFISVLEKVSPKEAEVILLMKDKKLIGKYKGVTKKLISDTFPGLIEK
tara:strand:- start:94 stop:519 length:426 start_codon:yes stop_codon:yes gene_type:complete